jgi:hypothetical protein
VQDADAHSGTACAKASYNHNGSAILQSPRFTLPNNPVRLKFWWADADWIGDRIAGHDTTFCEISDDAGAHWTNLATLSESTHQTAYTEMVIDLGAYVNQSVNIRFRDVTDGSATAYGVFLDDILLEVIPADALISLNPTTINFNQTVVGGTLTMPVVISNQGSNPLIITGITTGNGFSATNPGIVNPGQTALSIVSFTPQTAGQATATLTYQIQGTFSGVNTLQVNGSAYTGVSQIYQNFDASGSIPELWTTIVNAQSTVSYVEVRTLASDAHSGTNFVKMYNAGADTINAKLILVSPGVNQLSSHSLTFYAKSSWGLPTDTMILGSMSNNADPASFTALQTYNLTANYQPFSYTFDAALTDKFIAFKHGLGGAENYAVYIDDVSWEGTGSVPNPAVAPRASSAPPSQQPARARPAAAGRARRTRPRPAGAAPR